MRLVKHDELLSESLHNALAKALMRTCNECDERYRFGTGQKAHLQNDVKIDGCLGT